MKPSTTITDTIWRGAQWDGFALTCYKADGTTASDLSGCTASMVIKNNTTGTSQTVDCSIASNVITAGPLTAAETTDMDLGVYKGDLSITWPGSIPRAIYALFSITVADAESV